MKPQRMGVAAYTSEPGPTRHEIAPANGIIQMNQVVKTFKNAAGEFTVLKGLDLEIFPGEFVSIVGKSGSGKSTLLNMITGIDHPTSGEVLVSYTNIYAGMSESQRSLWRGENLGIVFQFFQLLPMLTLLENVMLPMDYVGAFTFDERPKRAMQLLELVGLQDFAHKLPLAVSTGQQQGAAIARSLATDPPVIVADEPTGNLDTRAAGGIIDLFEDLVTQGKTIVMVTHDPSLTMRTQRNIIISDGELVNETVARALPLLTHTQMLKVTQEIERQVYHPGQSIIMHDRHVDNFFMIERGTVEVVLERRTKKGQILAQLKAGDFFGEVSLLKGGRAIASVKASGVQPVHLLAQPRDQFIHMIQESPLTEEALCKIVQQRLNENRSARKGPRRKKK